MPGLIDEVLAEALLEDGANRRQVMFATGLPESAVAEMDTLPASLKRNRNQRWSQEDLDFLAAHTGSLSEVEIGAALGRTANAVKIKRIRTGLPAPTKQPDTFTLQGVARALGVDMHAVARWVDELSILPAAQAPVDGCDIRQVRLQDLKRFAVRPANWIYFDPLRVPHPALARLVRLAHERWDDAWLTTGQVAQMHGLPGSGLVNKYIREGRLPAVRWNNWRVLRSDAEAVTFRTGRGVASFLPWPEEAEAFLVLGRAVGLFYSALDAMVGAGSHRAECRLKRLHARGETPALIARLDLDVQYRAEDGALFADWKRHRRRFKRLARALDRFAAGARLSAQEMAYVRGVCAVWARWFGQQEAVPGFTYGGANWSRSTLARRVEELAALGVDPFAEA